MHTWWWNFIDADYLQIVELLIKQNCLYLTLSQWFSHKVNYLKYKLPANNRVGLGSGKMWHGDINSLHFFCNTKILLWIITKQLVIYYRDNFRIGVIFFINLFLRILSSFLEKEHCWLQLVNKLPVTMNSSWGLGECADVLSMFCLNSNLFHLLEQIMSSNYSRQLNTYSGMCYFVLELAK